MQLKEHEKQAVLVAAHHIGSLLSLHEIGSNEIHKKLDEAKPLIEKEMGKISENYYCHQVNHGYALLNLMCNH